MFRFFRKHRWLLIICLAVVAFSFVTFMGQGGGGNSRGGAIGDYGMVYDRKVTQQDYVSARNEVYLFYWFRNGTWPDRANISASELDQEIYINLMLDRKARDMGIHVSADDVAKAGASLLHSLDRNGQRITPDVFAKQ